MKLHVEIPIIGSKEQIWQVITDIENAASTISGIEKIEILEKPENEFVGLKWRETRTLFGKTATEIMWITEAEENSFYRTRAESHGSIYETVVRITKQNGVNILSMHFNGKAQSFGAKFFSFVLGFMFKGATKKALMQDLKDIKEAIEK